MGNKMKKVAYVLAGAVLGAAVTLGAGHLLRDKADFAYQIKKSGPDSYSYSVNGKPWGGSVGSELSFDEIMSPGSLEMQFMREHLGEQCKIRSHWPISELEIRVKK